MQAERKGCYKGAVFQIYLPVLQKEVQQEKKADKVLINGSGNVLFVDDEESMVLMGRAILEIRTEAR